MPNSNPNLFAFQQGLTEAYQEQTTEDFLFHKNIDSRENEETVKGIAKWITAAITFAVTGSKDAAKFAGEGGKYVADFFMHSEDDDMGSGGKYGYSRNKERQAALDRYDKQSKTADLIGTGAVVAGSFFKSDAFKAFSAGDIDFSQMVSTMKDDVKDEFLDTLLKFKTPIKSIGDTAGKVFLPNITKDWNFGGGD